MNQPGKQITLLSLGVASLSSAQAQMPVDTRQPVIARVEMLYSVVTHFNHLADRIDFYNRNGRPSGNLNYAVPHLVYEPQITLYNPYNTDLRLRRVRVRIENPPVGFRFMKNSDYLREEWKDGGPFHGLGRFQTLNEADASAQKTFTLSLSESYSTGQPGSPIVLKPGEARRYTAWVESNWKWGLETAGAAPRSFFDFDPSLDLTNQDGRTKNLFGVETVGTSYHGGDVRAGFQTDALSVASGRPAATRYYFETGTFGQTPWVACNVDDYFTVEAKGVDTVPNPALPDFQISLLGGKVQSPAADTVSAFPFHIDQLTQKPTASAGEPVTRRTFKIEDILQEPADSTVGGKTPIACFVVVAKSTALQQRKFQAEIQPPSDELYEARFEERWEFVPTDVLTNGPSDQPRSGVLVTSVERVGDNLMLDVAAEPFRYFPEWKILGGSDPGQDLTENLTSRSTIREGPSGSGMYKLTIPVPEGSEKYFVKLGIGY